MKGRPWPIAGRINRRRGISTSEDLLEGELKVEEHGTSVGLAERSPKSDELGNSVGLSKVVSEGEELGTSIGLLEGSTKG